MFGRDSSVKRYRSRNKNVSGNAIWLQKVRRKVNGKVQGVPQSQAAGNPCHQEEEKKDVN